MLHGQFLLIAEMGFVVHKEFVRREYLAGTRVGVTGDKENLVIRKTKINPLW